MSDIKCDINVAEVNPQLDCPEHGGVQVVIPDYYIWPSKPRLLCRNHAGWIIETWSYEWTAARIREVVN